MFLQVQHTTSAAVIVGSVCVWGVKDYFRVICIDKGGGGLHTLRDINQKDYQGLLNNTQIVYPM